MHAKCLEPTGIGPNQEDKISRAEQKDDVVKGKISALIDLAVRCSKQ